MNKYQDGKIYDITSNNTDQVYVGSCIVILKERLFKHKNERNCSSKFVIDCGDYTINLIENYPCNTKQELLMREQYHLDKYKNDGRNVVNQRRAYISIEDRKENYQEWRNSNKDKTKKNNKDYYQENKERIKEGVKEYKKKNKEHIKELNKEYGFFRRKDICNGFYDFSMMLEQY